MDLAEALEILTEGAVQDRAAFDHLDGRITQLMREMRKRARAEPGNKMTFERMIKVAGEVDLDLSKIQRSFTTLDAFAKKLHI